MKPALDCYRDFLSKRTDKVFSPQWFKNKAKGFPTIDTEADKLRKDFEEKFGPDKLKSLLADDGDKLLNAIFPNDGDNKENMCYLLEYDDGYMIFGSLKGMAYKYGLYYNNKEKTWANKYNKPIDNEEAIKLGQTIINDLVKGANTIAAFREKHFREKPDQPFSVDDYEELYDELKKAIGGGIDKIWFLKYYQMLYPDLFATYFSYNIQTNVLNAIGENKPGKFKLVRNGQICLYAGKCGISAVMFGQIFEKYYKDALMAKFSRNRIFFGAPGTGKSYTLNKQKDELLKIGNGDEYERVTFHPDYSYANFVGTYKPVPCKDKDGKEETIKETITYSYVPSPFMRTYVEAVKSERTGAPKPYLLIIEEINRANVAAVFGDVFQLLDRDKDGASEYPIQASEDMKKYLAVQLGGEADDYSEIRIPSNMFIWATMNSADQGVFPMDTAFKRRWDFTYLGIDENENGIAGKKVSLGKGKWSREVEWNALRKAINNELLKYNVNEDKLMGPYFISKNDLPEGDTIDSDAFKRIFKNKVIMYLFEDAVKHKSTTLFNRCDETSQKQYSKICEEFDKKGVFIFCGNISDKFLQQSEPASAPTTGSNSIYSV